MLCILEVNNYAITTSFKCLIILLVECISKTTFINISKRYTNKHL